ncbi:hypothetical protein N2152v2_003372 [Parachlorella kessleri]
MFGISIGEIVLIVGVGAYVFGPNELPRMGRTLGRFTGRATGLLYKMRARMFQFAEDTEVNKLHEEMRATMYQLSSIREELRGGINFMNPGPLTQRTLRIKPMPGQGTIDPYAEQHTSMSGVPFAAAGPAQHAQQAGLGQSPSFAATPFATHAAAAPAAAGLGLQPAPPPVAEVLPRPAADSSTAGAAGQGTPTAGAAAATSWEEEAGVGWQHPQYIKGISAVAAGLVPERSKSMPTGSEIVLDALMEEIVAHQAAAFLQQQHQQQQHLPQQPAQQSEPSAQHWQHEASGDRKSSGSSSRQRRPGLQEQCPSQD